jgi:hypothetical protein
MEIISDKATDIIPVNIEKIALRKNNIHRLFVNISQNSWVINGSFENNVINITHAGDKKIIAKINNFNPTNAFCLFVLDRLTFSPILII